MSVSYTGLGDNKKHRIVYFWYVLYLRLLPFQNDVYLNPYPVHRNRGDGQKVARQKYYNIQAALNSRHNTSTILTANVYADAQVPISLIALW